MTLFKSHSINYTYMTLNARHLYNNPAYDSSFEATHFNSLCKVTVYVAHGPKNMNHLEYIHLNKSGVPAIKETAGEK